MEVPLLETLVLVLLVPRTATTALPLAMEVPLLETLALLVPRTATTPLPLAMVTLARTNRTRTTKATTAVAVASAAEGTSVSHALASSKILI
jgi:hypothetical protein